MRNETWFKKCRNPEFKVGRKSDVRYKAFVIKYAHSIDYLLILYSANNMTLLASSLARCDLLGFGMDGRGDEL